ncbi:MAG: corrinoid protein [Bacillota bacterium]
MLCSIAEKVALGKAQEVRSLILEALRKGFKPTDVLEKGLIAGMKRISDKYRNLEICVPDVLLASRTMQGGLRLLKPLLSDKGRQPKGRIVIGTVAGDIHDIGKGLVSVVMEAAGYEVIDLGVDVPPDQFAEAIEEHEPDVLGMSSLLTLTMGVMEECIDLLERSNLRDRCKIIVGGAPISLEFAEDIGADGYAADAAECLEILEAVLDEKPYWPKTSQGHRSGA